MKQQVMKAGNLLATAYMLIMFVLYPFYMKNGYADLGEAKYHFFFYVTTAAVILLLVLAGVTLLIRIREKKSGERSYLFSFEKVSGVDLLVLLYLSEAFVSFAFSDYRREAFFGTEGWYMGFATILLLCLIYFLIGGFWKDTIKIYAAPVTASSLVFLLGILNRFSVYLPFQEMAGGEFISTLGNINWFCGYFSVIAPIGFAMYFLWSARTEDSCFDVRKGLTGEFLAILLLCLVFTAAFSQGSNSIFLVIAAEFLFFTMVTLENKVHMMQIPIFLSTIGAGMIISGELREGLPGRFNYELDELSSKLLDPENGMWICLIAVAIGFFCHIRSGKESRTGINLLKVILPGTICFMILFFPVTVIMYMTGRLQGIDQAGLGSLLTFDENWGNGRGASMITGIRIFQELPLSQKLFGAGPDCFSACAYSIPELTVYLYENFGTSRLTNAHNELITTLVNTGITGVILYYTMMAVFIKRCMNRVKEDPAFYIPAACVTGYLIHNLISFSQVLSFPYVFLLMGMERAMERRLDKNKKFS